MVKGSIHNEEKTLFNIQAPIFINIQKYTSSKRFNLGFSV